MLDKKTDIKQLFSRGFPKKFRISSGVAEFVFMIIGVGLTLSAFLALNVFVQGMIKHEYEQMTQNTVEILAEGFKELEQSVDTLATMMSLSADGDKSEMFRKIRSSGSEIDYFDQIIWIYQKEAGKWQYQNIYLKDQDVSDLGIYQINLNKNFLSYIVDRDIFSSTQLTLLREAEFFKAQIENSHPYLETTPIALLKVIARNDPASGFLVGVTTAASVLDQSWIRNNDMVHLLTLRDIGNGHIVYNLQRPANQNELLEDLDQVYEFGFGGKKWEIKIEYLKDGKVYFLENVPFYLLIFGLILTAAGTLYIHSSQQQSVRTQQLNKVLEEKNMELEGEVAKRKEVFEILKRSEREQKSILDSVSDIIFETDTKGQILFLNATWKKVTGFDPEQSKGLELIKMLHPQDQEKQADDFALLVQGQKEGYRVFTRLRTAEGSFRAVEMAISMIRQDDQNQLRVVGTFTDVEERRRAERALSEAEKKYRTIVENAAGGIFQLTPEGVYLSANPALARTLGYDSAEDLLRSVKNANEMVYINSRERIAFVKELENIGMINNFETQVLRKDGQRIWVSENVRVVKDDNGNTLYYEGSMEDITQRKKADLALREAKINSDLANRAKSEFLANMSHELRTPLNAIIGFSEIIKNEVFGKIEQESYKEYSKDIYESGKKLLKIINEILDISKIEAGERHLNEQIVDVSKIVARCLDLLGTKVQANNLKVTNNLKEDLPKVIGEELALKQVVMNLLSNAVKFTPNGGRVTISHQVNPDGSLRLSFTDTGVGLDESEIEKALSPFGQIDNALSRGNAGTGLGLTLVNALVKLHGGKLELFSEKGIGTTVTVVFPADRISVKKEGAVKTPELPQNPAENIT